MDKEACQLSHPGITGLTMVNSICSPICTVKLVSLVDVIPISLMMQSSIQIYIWCKKSRADPESLSSKSSLTICPQHFQTFSFLFCFRSLLFLYCVTVSYHIKSAFLFFEKHRPFDTSFTNNCCSTLFENFPIIALVLRVPLPLWQSACVISTQLF